MLALGNVHPGSTLYIPFETFAGATGAPITMTGFAVGDIKIYKDGSTTERASTSGFTLLDTDGTDFDGITGIQGFSIDLSDNTTADFYKCGSKYFVVISTVTVDGQTMSFIAAHFRIAYENAFLSTFIATLSSQTSFTLSAGPAEDNALKGMQVIVQNAASGVQKSMCVISAYTGSTKTVTLAAGATFTAAVGDNISVLNLAPLQPVTPGRTVVVDANGVADANLIRILGTLLTETAGQLAAGFKKFFNVTAPTAQADNLPLNTDYTSARATKIDFLTGDAYARIGAAGAGLTALGDTRIANLDAAVSTRLASASYTAPPTAAQNRAEMDANSTKLANLDATVSSRLASGSYTAPPSAAANRAEMDSNSTQLAKIGTPAGASLAADIAGVPTALLDLANGVETGLTLRQAMRLIAAAEAGQISGAATTTIVIKAAGVPGTTRITATVDADGNRSSLTLNP